MITESLDTEIGTGIGAGIVVYRLNVEGKIEFLLLRSNWNEKKWSFPKGQLAKGESILKCALREVKEETSIDQESICLVGNFKKEIVIKLPKATRNTPSAKKKITFFLARVSRTVTVTVSKEHSIYGWYTAARAVELLPLEMKPLVHEARVEILKL